MAAKKAHQVLGQMSRGLHFRDKRTWIQLYTQYCRPHLDYCAQAYSPWTVADTDLLESVQERAVRMVSGLKGKTYKERLKEVGLTTLSERRVRGDQIQVWKTLHQKDNVNPETWFSYANQRPAGIPTRHTSHPWNLEKQPFKSDIRKYFWSVRCVDTWNSLPTNLKSAETLDSFNRAFQSSPTS